MAAHGDVAATLAERLGLGSSLYGPMRQLFARWDGKGTPRLRGEAIALSIRLVQLADVVEAHRSVGGPQAALAVARSRAGTQFDPSLVSDLERHADELFAGLDGTTTWEEVVAAEPAPSAPFAEDDLDEAFSCCGLHGPQVAVPRGHSRGVAALEADAAEVAGMT